MADLSSDPYALSQAVFREDPLDPNRLHIKVEQTIDPDWSSLDEAMKEIGDAVEGLRDWRITMEHDYGYYDEVEHDRLTVAGWRPASDAETVALRLREAQSQARAEAIRRQQQEAQVAELRRLRPELFESETAES